MKFGASFRIKNRVTVSFNLSFNNVVDLKNFRYKVRPQISLFNFLDKGCSHFGKPSGYIYHHDISTFFWSMSADCDVKKRLN